MMGVIVTEITRHVRAVANAPIRFITEMPWFVRHRNLVKPMFLFKITIALVTALTLLWIILVGALAPRLFIDACPTPEVIAQSKSVTALALLCGWLPIIYIIASLTPLAFIARRLSKQEKSDAFGILTELKTIGYSCTFIIVMEFVQIFGQFSSYFTLMVILSAELAIFIPTIVVPIVRSYQFQSAQRHQAHLLEQVNKVEDLLALPQGYEIFTQYCQSEFCSEGNFVAISIDQISGCCNDVA
jgi:hypothetical protein